MTLTQDFPGFIPKPRASAIGFQPTPQLTPTSNTGVNWTEQPKTCVSEVGIDWLAGTTHESNIPDLMADLGHLFTDEFVDQEKPTGFYRDSYRSVLGILVGLHPYSGGREDSYISIPGSVLSAVAPERVHELLGLLIGKYNFHYSRMDLKLDDYTKTVTPELAYAAYQRGNVSGFRSHHWHSSGSEQKGIGRTLELGRRGKFGAGKFLRIYDKFIESAGKIDATRIELELSGEHCRQAATLLASTPFECLGKYIFDMIASSVDFVERDSSGRLDRSKRLDWWAFLADGREQINLAGIRIKSTLDSVKRWIHNQVSPALATIVNAFNNEQDWNDWFWDMLMNGETRMQDRHHALVNVDRKLKAMIPG